MHTPQLHLSLTFNFPPPGFQPAPATPFTYTPPPPRAPPSPRPSLYPIPPPSTPTNSSTRDHLPARPRRRELQPQLGQPEEVSDIAAAAVGLVLVHVTQPIHDPTHAPRQPHGGARDLK